MGSDPWWELLTCTGPTQGSCGHFTFVLLHALPKVFCVLLHTYFLSFKRALQIVYISGLQKNLDPPLLRGMGGVGLQIVSVSLRE